MTESPFQAAIMYSSQGMSVIPTGQDKKPLVKWEQYNKKAASMLEIAEWFKKYPKAQIGIVTGSVSGICVVDVDNEEGKKAIQEYIPSSDGIPIAHTPKGGFHMYFKHPGEEVRNNARRIPGCDFRGDGGYVVAPPSIGVNNVPYRWRKGFSGNFTSLPALPILYLNNVLKGGGIRGGGHQKSSKSSNVIISFEEGCRDNSLFSVANALIKGGMDEANVLKTLEHLVMSWGETPDRKWISAKVESALSRVERKERCLTQDVRDWVLSSNGIFLSSEVIKSLQLSSRDEQRQVSNILRRLSEDKLIEKAGNKNGTWRVVENTAEEINWFDDDGQFLDVRMPLGVDQWVKLSPGNVVVVAGEPNAGKTAFLLNTALMNLGCSMPVHYFSSEMGPHEVKTRLKKFGQPLEVFKKIKFIERSENFADVIEPDAINIIDFLEVHDEFWKIGLYMKQIFDKLKNGIAFIAIQKNRGSDFGLGGMRGMEKARLYLSIEPNKLKIVKGKNWANEEQNPNGQEINFKLVAGCKFLNDSPWRMEVRK